MCTRYILDYVYPLCRSEHEMCTRYILHYVYPLCRSEHEMLIVMDYLERGSLGEVLHYMHHTIYSAALCAPHYI
jgi:hypothetical protein